MNRREFFKALGISLSAALVPIPILEDAAYAHFDPTKVYGNWFQFSTEFVEPENIKCAVAHLEEEIRDVIPGKYRKQVKWLIRQPSVTMEDPYAAHVFISWKYQPESIKLN